MQPKNQKVYIVVSQTGSIVSKMLGLFTGDRYNHVSVSLQQDLQAMYSFGRRHPYFPFWGGFVKESLSYGTFHRFTEAEGIVMAMDISSEQYNKLHEHIHNMYDKRSHYCYNYLGLALAAFSIYKKFRNRYYCSEFVRELLAECDVISDDCFGSIVKPMQFLDLADTHIIYDGRLQDYCINDNTYTA